jgi:hypothetical protein
MYSTEAKQHIHEKCCLNTGQAYKMPAQNVLKFNKYSSMCKRRHVIYYDFETCLMKYSSSSELVHHVPIAVGAKRICTNPEYNSKLFCYVGVDVLKNFSRGEQK